MSLNGKIKLKTNPQVGLGQAVDVETEPNETIRELKNRIATMQAADPARIALQHQGKILDENAQVKDYSFKEGDVIDVLPNNRVGGVSLNPSLLRNRIMLESQAIVKSGIDLRPDQNTPYIWHGFIYGKKKWKGKYQISMIITANYPYAPPIVHWKTILYPKHPNITPERISDYGNVCLNILNGDWRPQFTLITVYNSLEWLLENPHYHGWEIPSALPDINSTSINDYLAKLFGKDNKTKNTLYGGI